jgi:hypothetical protein
MDFSKLKENKSTAALLKSLQKTSFAKSNKYGNDETEWRISKDKEGNGSAIIRFVASPDGELFQEVRNHGFKKNGKWYIQNCPKTLDWDNACPVCEEANKRVGDRKWDEIPKAEQDEIRPMFAKTSYWSNVLVIKDPAEPENEGKVFKFRFGKKILDKIVARLQDDELEGKEGINVFDNDDGANFKLIVKKVAGWANYDDSSFMAPSKLKNGDEVVKNGHEIGWMRSDKNFKVYEELCKAFNKVMGSSSTPTKTAEDYVSDDIPEDTGKYSKKSDSTENESTDDEDDDYMKYLESLAQED